MYGNQEPPAYESTINNSPIGPSGVYLDKQQSREEKYRNIIRKYEISADFANRLQQLQGFKIVFIFDDSGSMNTTLQDSPLNNPSVSLFRATRWDELQYFAKISIEIATIFDENGCDIYFLNRRPSPVRYVKSAQELTNLFAERPNGYTPLPAVLNTVLMENRAACMTEKKLLVLIATDGEPTDDMGRTAVVEFKHALLSRGPRVFTTIVVCTDDEESVKYLNRWDRKMPNLDVVDDFRNEREEIRRAKGHNFPFSFGDYVVKALIGAIDIELDRLDETNGCCTTL